MPRAITARRGEYFTHRKLWLSSQQIAQLGALAARDGDALRLSAMLLAALSVEAYCNFVISVLDQKAFEDERKLGNTGRKLRWIGKKCGFVASKLPGYQEFVRLTAFRDRVVHGKPDPYDYEKHHRATGKPFMQPRELQSAITQKNCDRMLPKTRVLCEAVHAHALTIVGNEQKRRLGKTALDGDVQLESTVLCTYEGTSATPMRPPPPF